MNPYEESLLDTHRADLARERRALQLSSESGASPDSETELFTFATVKRIGNRLERWITAKTRWLRAHRRPVRAPQPTAPAVRPAGEPRSAPTAIK